MQTYFISTAAFMKSNRKVIDVYVWSTTALSRLFSSKTDTNKYETKSVDCTLRMLQKGTEFKSYEISVSKELED